MDVNAASNRELAASLRAMGREPTGAQWIAARVLRSAGLPMTEELLGAAELAARHVLEESPALSYEQAERRAHQLWSASSAGDSDGLSVDGRRAWFFVFRDEMFSHFDLVEGRTSSSTCDAATRRGDLALLYRGRPASAIVALLEVTSDARVVEDLDAQARNWKYFCDYRVLRVISPGVHLHELREESELEDLAALRRNFQASAVPIEEHNWPVLLEILRRHDVDVDAALSGLAAVEVARHTFASEADMESHLEANLELFSPFGFDLEPVDVSAHGLRHRQHALSGGGSRTDLLCLDRLTGRLVVIELKNTLAKPEHVGQLCSYLGWFLTFYPYVTPDPELVAGEVEGVLVTRGDTPSARQARLAVPGVSHIGIDELLLGAPTARPEASFRIPGVNDAAENLALAAQSLAARLDTVPWETEGEEAINLALEAAFGLLGQRSNELDLALAALSEVSDGEPTP